MSGERIAISVKNVSKNFRLPHQKTSSIKDVFIHPVRALGGAKTAEVQHALRDVSFDVKEGEFFGIVGRNGSGKSTLLKILAEIYQPTKGEVSVVGKLVPFIELGVGFNPELTGRENVYLSGALNGFSDKEIDEMYDDIVEFAELEPFMDQLLKNYSSGMQVRLAFSVATRSSADILLIDEVLAVGDADFQRKCFEYFDELKKTHKTVVFVSHDMSAIRQYCDRAALIDGSKVVEINDAETVAKKYAQLFAEKLNGEQPAVKGERWGDRKAYYDNVKAKLVDDQKNVLLTMRVRATQDIPDPTYGFKVSNQSRQPILGTNTKINQQNIEPLKAGQDITIKWKFPNIFNDGKLYVELVLMYNSVTQVADWWEDAQSFAVTNKERTPYIVSPATEFTIE